MSIANQQTLAESGAEGRPPILEKGSYVPWASRFLRFLDNKREEGELMRNLIDKGPYKRREIVDPKDNTQKILEPIKDLSPEDQKQYYADIKVMNYILQGIPNDIYNSVDACNDAQNMWNQIKRLMQGTYISKQERHSRLMNEFDKFVAEDGESLTSVYERFSTLINIMDQNEVKPFEISINTKLLNSLQLAWSKYATLTHQKFILEKEHYDVLYDYLSQFEPHVKASKAKKVVKNHDPLALVANSHANPPNSHARPSYSRSPQLYYVTHPPFMIDYDDDYQGEIQGDAQEDKLSTAMIKNVGYAGNGNRNARRTNRNQTTNARNGLVQNIKEYDQSVQRVLRTESNPGKTNVHNCNGKGHYARDCPKPRVHDAKYFREQMLLAIKDEAGFNLDAEVNDFMLMNAYGDYQLKELNASMIMMAHIQSTDDKSDAKPTYDVELIIEVNALNRYEKWITLQE
ncbi:putative ribonuclease H-like domain-containing protein [Tanacetum coccineum]